MAVAGTDSPPAPVSTLHHETLHRLVSALPGTTTRQLQDVYEAVSTVVYRGTTETPIESRRYRRELLDELEAAGLVESARVGRLKIWWPTGGEP